MMKGGDLVKKTKIALIVLLVLLVALPLFARGRKSRMQTPGLAISLFGGIENLTGASYAMAPDSQMFYSVGANLIIPIYRQLICRFGVLNIGIHDDLKTYALSTGVSGDFMYYFPLQMAFTPYGFLGFWYTGSSATDYSTSDLHLHLGAGGEMKMMYHLFAEVGFDMYNNSVSVNGNSTSTSSNPIFAHFGVRFPLIR